MSIATAIQNAQQKIANAYTAISNKGGTLPATQDLSNMPTAINSISTGGGDHGGEYLIQVVDEYGNVLKQDHLNEGATFEMPTPPTRTGLTFDKWVGSAPISNGEVTMPDYDVYFMPMYYTTSGKLEVTIKVKANNTVQFENAWDDFICDWGDGSTPDNLNMTSSHTYSADGTYTLLVSNDNAYSDFSAYITVNSNTGSILPIEVNMPNVTNQYGYKFTSMGFYDSGYSNNYNYMFRPSSTTLNPMLFAKYPSLITKHMQSVSLANDVFNTAVVDYQYSYNNSGGGGIGSIPAYKNTTVSTSPNALGIFGNIYKPYYTTIVSLATALNSMSLDKAYGQGTTFYLKNITAVPGLALSNTSSPLDIYNPDTIIVPFDMWYNFAIHEKWSIIRPWVISKTPATINPTISAGETLTVFGEQVTGQFINYGSAFDFTYNDGTNTYIGTYTGIQPNSVNNIDFSSLPYKTVTISCGVPGLTITSSVPFTDNGDGTYTTRIYSSSTSLAYSIDGGVSYMDYSGSIDLTQQSPITETITLVPATSSAWTQPTLSSNGTIGGNSFAVKSQSISTANVWKAFDNSDSTTWGQSNGSSITYNTPVLLIYNPEGLNISQIVFHTTSATAAHPAVASSSATTGKKFQASKDGETWVTLDATATNDTLTTSDRIVTINNNTEFYKYYRYTYAYSSSGSTWVQMLNVNKKIDITATYKVPATT